MRTVQYTRLPIAAAVLTGTSLFAGMTGWPQSARIAEFPGVMLAAVLVAAFAQRSPAAEARGMIRPCFVVEFGALLLLGGNPALAVAAAGMVMRQLAEPRLARPLQKTLFNAAVPVVAIELAWLAYSALGGVPGHFAWPWQAVPIAAAVAVYGVLQIVASEEIAPRLGKEAVDKSWPASLLRNGPHYFIATTF